MRPERVIRQRHPARQQGRGPPDRGGGDGSEGRCGRMDEGGAKPTGIREIAHVDPNGKVQVVGEPRQRNR